MKKNLPLLVGIALPLVFIGLIALFVFLPTTYIKPAHDFVYASVDGYYDYYYVNTYNVENGQIALASSTAPVPNPSYVQRIQMPDLFVYNVKDNSSHKITFEEAKKYTLDPGPTSPDGYNIQYDYSHDGIFEVFGSNNNSGYFIAKDKGQKRLTGLVSDRYWGQGNFKLIGWIK